VFAGEDIDCEITFKNIATTPAPPRALLHPGSANSLIPGGDRQRKQHPLQIKSSSLSSRPAPPDRGHRTTLSLSAPVNSVRPSHGGSGSWNGGPSPKNPSHTGSHKRSVSIISIGASETAVDDLASHASLPEGSRRGPRGHGRSASLQIIPRRGGVNGGLSISNSKTIPL
jgi:hypothetical protein